MFTTRSLARARWILRIVLAVQCCGVGGQLLWGTYETEADVYGLLLFGWQWPEAYALLAENAGTWLYVACGLSLLILPPAGRWAGGEDSSAERVSLWLQAGCLVWLAAWQGLLSGLHGYRGGSFMAEWSLAAHAVRIFSPLALLALLRAATKGEGDVKGEGDAKGAVDAKGEASASALVGDWLLRLATAVTFITHGIEAIRQNPKFVDLIIGSAENLLGIGIAQSSTTIPLYVIGVIDIILAILLIGARWRVVAAYMSFWGFVTALSRVTAAGWFGLAWEYPETLIRAANGGAPLAICILWGAAATADAASRYPSHAGPSSQDPGPSSQDKGEHDVPRTQIESS